MGLYKFGSKELCKLLKKLGFLCDKNKGSSHLKFKLPPARNCPKGTRPFIIVIIGRKIFDPHTCTSYVRQIKNLGYSEKEISKYL